MGATGAYFIIAAILDRDKQLTLLFTGKLGSSECCYWAAENGKHAPTEVNLEWKYLLPKSHFEFISD